MISTVLKSDWLTLDKISSYFDSAYVILTFLVGAGGSTYLRLTNHSVTYLKAHFPITSAQRNLSAHARSLKFDWLALSIMCPLITLSF